MADSQASREELVSIKRALLQTYGQIAEVFGIRGLKQEILGALFLAPGIPLSLTELTEQTHFSKASTSRALRELEMELPMIEPIKKPNDREKYYRLNANFLDMVSGFLRYTITAEAEPTIEITSEALKRFEKLRKKTTEQDLLTEIDEMIRRVKLLFDVYSKFIRMAPKLLAYWDKLDKQYDKLEKK